MTDQAPGGSARPAPIRIPLMGEGGGKSCCPPPPSPTEKTFPYRDWPCLTATLPTAVGPIPVVATTLTWHDTLGRWQMRWGFGRDRYRIRPGLYSVGTPDAHAPVLVSANYKLSFDTLRAALDGRSCWLLVLDTKGINVWCAAGKGTFGTAEVLLRVAASRLAEVVSHRTLIVPQLGAVGVAAHEVVKGCGFRVIYGPVRASDLPAFLAAGMQATPAMRRVSFSAGERLILTPVELTAFGRRPLGVAFGLFLAGGLGPDLFSLAMAWSRGSAAILTGLAGLITGAVLTPVCLPWIPGRAFALKGGLAGLAIAATGAALYASELGRLNSLALCLALPAVASYGAMNFTGSSTFTSPSGVEKEMRRFIPLQLIALLAAGMVWILAAFQGVPS